MKTRRTYWTRVHTSRTRKVLTTMFLSYRRTSYYGLTREARGDLLSKFPKWDKSVSVSKRGDVHIVKRIQKVVYKEDLTNGEISRQVLRPKRGGEKVLCVHISRLGNEGDIIY
ncbi:hypothetical protein [Salmonella phage SSBI34]|nr:hypothetical protein [Salmonella phage SSBI34]